MEAEVYFHTGNYFVCGLLLNVNGLIISFRGKKWFCVCLEMQLPCGINTTGLEGPLVLTPDTVRFSIICSSLHVVYVSWREESDLLRGSISLTQLSVFRVVFNLAVLNNLLMALELKAHLCASKFVIKDQSLAAGCHHSPSARSFALNVLIIYEMYCWDE